MPKFVKNGLQPSVYSPVPAKGAEHGRNHIPHTQIAVTDGKAVVQIYPDSKQRKYQIGKHGLAPSDGSQEPVKKSQHTTESDSC